MCKSQICRQVSNFALKYRDSTKIKNYLFFRGKTHCQIRGYWTGRKTQEGQRVINNQKRKIAKIFEILLIRYK